MVRIRVRTIVKGVLLTAAVWGVVWAAHKVPPLVRARFSDERGMCVSGLDPPDKASCLEAERWAQWSLHQDNRAP